MRRTFLLLHRWAGLLMAGFLIVTGFTGAVISWDHELDEWLNPQLNEARSTGPALDALTLAEAIEGRHAQIQVTSLPLAGEPGHAYAFWVEPRIDPASGKPYAPGFNQVFVDPVSGEELGKRQWGAVWPVTRENFVSFLYKLHYSLHLPAIGGIDHWGVWLLGIIALIWTIDCFTGVLLTLPARRRTMPGDEKLSYKPAAGRRSFWQRWQASWKVRWQGGPYQVNFDLHRAASLWTWGLLFVIAFTAFSLNLYREVFFPAMSLLSDVTPSPFELRTPTAPEQAAPAHVTFRQAVNAANSEAISRGWREPAGSVFYSREFGIYGIAFFHPADGHGLGGVGHKQLYYDGQDGRYLGDRQPWKGSAADLFAQAQFPLHSGRILGLPGRILISAMGLVVAMLSITGVYIWWRKHLARLRTKRHPERLLPAATLNGQDAEGR